MNIKLYVFTISHFCEKARWALDHYGVDYQLISLAPGSHSMQAKKMGLSSSTLPILQLGEQVIQGSSEIIDWASANNEEPSLSLEVDDDLKDQASEFEERLDSKVGVHTRRMFYSEALVESPKIVKPVFKKDLGVIDKLMLDLAWPKIRNVMIKRMDLGYQQGLQSEAILDEQMAWLDGLLADGRDYLVGDQLSRVDITAASLLGRTAKAKEYPGSDTFQTPPRMDAKVVEWRASGPTLDWVARLYETHR